MLADQCVQCGLCLPACPTYARDRVEAESPRGRIALARAWALHTVEPTSAGDLHLDHCLGCRSCEAVCPADVQFGALLVQARSRQRERRPPTWRQHAREWLTARPRILSRLLRMYRHAWPALPQALRPLPRPPAPLGRSVPAAANAIESVAVFRGCVARGYEDGLQQALERLAAAVNVRIVAPKHQSCCGALHAHAGNNDAASALAARNRQAFAGAGTVLTLASGCHEGVAMALQGQCKTLDAIEFIAARVDRLDWHETCTRIALHLPCTQRNVVGSAAATRALLARVPGLEVIELKAGPVTGNTVDRNDGCCGAAGAAMLEQPMRAAGFRQPLLDQLQASGASCLLSANIGCRLHLANAATVPVLHPLEFLARCLPAPSTPP